MTKKTARRAQKIVTDDRVKRRKTDVFAGKVDGRGRRLDKSLSNFWQNQNKDFTNEDVCATICSESSVYTYAFGEIPKWSKGRPC